MAVIKETKTYCTNCREEFYTDYNHGGAIEHDNETNDHNMGVFVHRFKKGYYENNSAFLESIMVNGNFCMMKNHTYKIAIKVFSCKIKWLEKNNFIDIADYLKSHENKIKEIYDYLKFIVDEYSDKKAESMWYEFKRNMNKKELS